MLNQCIITGNLGNDPVSHYTPENLAISSFNINFNSSHKKKVPNWIKVSCFGKLAEVSSMYLHKGARIALVGILDQHKWQTETFKTHNTHNTFQIIANTIEFIKNSWYVLHGHPFQGGSPN